jgi:hypothetical protein
MTDEEETMFLPLFASYTMVSVRDYISKSLGVCELPKHLRYQRDQTKDNCTRTQLIQSFTILLGAWLD